MSKQNRLNQFPDGEDTGSITFLGSPSVSPEINVVILKVVSLL